MIVLRVINYTVILVAFSSILFWSAIFYLGNEESYALLKEKLPFSFLARFIGFWILCLIVSFCLWLLNWFIIKAGLVEMENSYPLRIAKLTLAILSLAALVGTVLFFSN